MADARRLSRRVGRAGSFWRRCQQMAASCRAAVQASVGVRALVAGAPGVFWDFNPNLRDCATIGVFSQRGAVCPRGAPSYPPVTPMGALDVADGHIRTEMRG